MTEHTPNLTLPRILPAQAQKHVTHNDALQVIDALTQLTVKSRALSTPPSAPDSGASWIVAADATGAWDGADGKLAIAETGGWRLIEPKEGWVAYCLDEAATLRRKDGEWTVEGMGAATFGVNATADTYNRLSVAADATLLTHESGSHRLKVNKAGPSETASLVFQSNWSARAELGLTGHDKFTVKVSPDGSSYVDALTVAPDGDVVTSVGLTAPQVALRDGGSHVETRAGNGLELRHSADGGTTWSGWTPVSGVKTQGAEGTAVRHVDGRQEASHRMSVTLTQTPVGAWFSQTFTWTLPTPFATPPVISAAVEGAVAIASLASISTTQAQIVVSSPVDLSGTATTIHLTAVGDA